MLKNIRGLTLNFQLKLITFVTLNTNSIKKNLGVAVLETYFQQCVDILCSTTFFTISENVAILDISAIVSNEGYSCSEEKILRHLKHLLSKNDTNIVKRGEKSFPLFAIDLSNENMEGQTGIKVLNKNCPDPLMFFVTKEWFYDCPYISVDLLNSSSVSESVIKEVRSLSLHTEGRAASICLETYLSIHQRNPSRRNSANLSLCAILTLLVSLVNLFQSQQILLRNLMRESKTKIR